MAAHTSPPDPATTVTTLTDRLAGNVATGDAERALFATDASVYRQQPEIVVFPQTVTDVQEAIAFASETGRSVTARGAGSSLTGNAIGSGVIIDTTRHLTDIQEINPAEQSVTVDPGVVLNELNESLQEYGLYFPPDPSTSDTCTIGGMVANDAAGAHSVRHGTTRDNVESVEVVLADGSIATFGEVDGEALEQLLATEGRVGEVTQTVSDLCQEHADEIAEQYPDVDRNSSGYDLQSAGDADGQWLDLSKLLVGSEGTLGFITSVTLDLTPRPERRAAAMIYYESVVMAADAVQSTLTADPSAVELIDDTVLKYARSAWDFERIPEDAGAALLVEVESTSERAISDRLDVAIDMARTDSTVAVERAVESDEQETLWKIRKASNPLLNRRPGPEEAPSFIEDAAIPTSELAGYLSEVLEVLDKYALETSVFGHAGQGVLHIKPFLDLRTVEDREIFEAVSEEVHTIVLEHGGSVSGEHGDGRLRSRYVKQQYGKELYAAFRRVKQAFDPEGVFNPGIIVPDSGGTVAELDEGFRYEDYEPSAPEPSLDFGEEKVGGHIERCNGCSKCRSTGDGVMCPTYRATRDEVMSTRGRANLLREAMDGTLGQDAIESDWFHEEVLDLCISCKGCETECPTGVDMAKLKTELKHQKHQSDGIPLRSRLFANIRFVNRLGTALAPMTNWIKDRSFVKRGIEATMGIDSRRSLPDFAAESFLSWYSDRGDSSTPKSGRKVVFFPDSYTSYNHPDVGKAAVLLLENLGYDVVVPPVTDSGRASLSQGMIDRARAFAETNVDVLAPYADENTPVVGVEPSSVSALVEYDDLLDDAKGVPEIATTVSQFILDDLTPQQISDAFSVRRNQRIAYHGHCHAKAKGWSSAVRTLLSLAGYDVVETDTTCCGMAGSFGYESEHYDLSVQMGANLENQLDAVDPDVIAVTGASCSQQLADSGRNSRHPIQLLSEGVITNSSR